MLTHRRLHVLVPTLAAAFALGTGVVSAATPTPAGTTPTDSAWIVVRDPLEPSGIPFPMDRGNSTGEAVTWTRSSAGNYTVLMDGLDDDGVFQVTALSTVPRICYVNGWGGVPVVVNIACTDTSGTPRDTPFAVTYTRGMGDSGGSPGRLAHAWLDDDVPDAEYNHVTGGGAITRSELSPGDYEALIPGLGNDLATGTFQFTRYGHPGYCKTFLWSSSSDDMVVRLKCRDLDGNLSSSAVDLLFLRKLGPEGFGGGPAAYLFAHRKSASAPYQPDRAYAWQSNGKRSTIDRTTVGVYKVTLKGLPKGGAANVTAHGSDKARCQLGKILTTAPATVVVRCYTPAGALVNSNFTLAWTK